MIDGLMTKKLLRTLKAFPHVVCIAHRAVASKYQNQVMTANDLADALSYHLLILFIPKEEYEEVQKVLKQTLRAHRIAMYESVVEKPSWL